MQHKHAKATRIVKSATPNRVVREGRRFRDAEAGYNVYVDGERVVITNAEGKIVTQFKNSRANTQERLQSGRWEIVE